MGSQNKNNPMCSAMATLVDFKSMPKKRMLEESDDGDDSEDYESSEAEDEIEKETPEAKRLRLATIYLEELQRKEEETAQESVSHETVNERLRQEELEQSQKLVKPISDTFDSFGQVTYHRDK